MLWEGNRYIILISSKCKEILKMPLVKDKQCVRSVAQSCLILCVPMDMDMDPGMICPWDFRARSTFKS